MVAAQGQGGPWRIARADRGARGAGRNRLRSPGGRIPGRDALRSVGQAEGSIVLEDGFGGAEGTRRHSRSGWPAVARAGRGDWRAELSQRARADCARVWSPPAMKILDFFGMPIFSRPRRRLKGEFDAFK